MKNSLPLQMNKYNSVDEYINSFPEDVQVILKKLRQIVKEIAPEAVESISYGMAGYKLKGRPLVYFAGYKSHIGFYPVPSGLEAFKEELKPYQTGKGTAQFKLGQPIPYDLVKKIVKYRKEENLAS